MTQLETPVAPPRLPPATSERWQPLRSGLVNLFKYDDEEFHFEQGNLLWRGSNGAGKTRALALQLPFLLDGQTAAHRLEPDGDASKSMAWNLLMGKHDDRQGYTWLELGRRDDEGEHYLTLGCGLKAARGRKVESWFFVTPQRVGRDLFLVGASRCTLGKKLLEQALGDDGRLFTSASHYRRAVDAALFGLGEERYEALLKLLIELRKPQLSRTLDEGRLSGALSQALAPLDDDVLGDVAEAFRELESDRAELEGYLHACQSVSDFLQHYTHYARVATRRRTGRLRSAHNDVEDTGKRLRAAERELQNAGDEVVACRSRQEAFEIDERKAEQRLRTLGASSAMREAKELEWALKRASELARAREDATERAEQAEAQATEQEGAAQRADEHEGALRAALSAAQAEATKAAGSVGLDGPLERTLLAAGLPNEADAPRLAQAQAEAQHALDGRRDHAEHLRTLDQQFDTSALALAEERRRQQQLQEDLDDALDCEIQATESRSEAARELVTAFVAWAAGLEELAPRDVEGVADELEAWCVDADGTSPAQRARDDARDEQVQRLAAQQARLTAEREGLTAQREALLAEQAELEAGRHRPPLPPPWRDAEARDQVAGAPLWRLVEFRDDVAAELQPRIEAALEAAGLLDAWVSPDGRLVPCRGDGWRYDTALVVGHSQRAPAGRSLGGVLQAAIDPGDPQLATLAPEVIAEVLDHVGYGAEAGEVWVDGEGRYQVGPLRGAWSKGRVEHVGEGARQATRRRRLAALADELAAVDRGLADVDARNQATELARQRLYREAEALPNHDPLRRAAAAAEAAHRQVGAARGKVTAQEETVLAARAAHDEARALRLEQATDLGLAAWIGRARELDQALSSCMLAWATLWTAAERRIEAGQRAASARQAAARARAAADAARRDARAKTIAAGEAEEQARTLDETAGAGAREIQRAYAQAEQDRLQLRDALAAQRDRLVETSAEYARVEQLVGGLGKDHERLRQARLGALDDLKRLAQATLVEVALGDGVATEGPPETWSVTRGVEVAREAERVLAQVPVDDESWTRAHREIHQHVQELINALLPHNYEPTAQLEGEALVVRVPFQGEAISPAALERTLASEVSERQGLLSQREREVIENHLIGEVASHLHGRLHAAERLVHDMNAEIERCPTSTGVELRLRWEVVDDGPAGLAEARKRLLALGATWSLEDRAALGDFLQARIQSVRDEQKRGQVTGTWHELLRQALDYRAWHRFAIERHQDGVWKRLTRRTHGTGSGGEKAIALTIPQLAAAAAHYRSASRLAPRFILLDEAFVGVDAPMRAKCMGLLTAFDLDLVMTSEREWGCYPTLPGIAICQLATAPGVDAIHVTRWVWNGRERRRIAAAPVGASAPNPPCQPPNDERQLSLLPQDPAS